MNISYQKVIDWLRNNIKLILISEIICFLVATFYFLLSPRIYEANFSISLPKVPISAQDSSQVSKLKLMISPQEFIRPAQDPFGYPAAFIDECMGRDTNANRKQFINGLQLGVKQNGDVIAFTLRLQGERQTENCAKLLLTKILNDLALTQEGYLKSAGIDLSTQNYQKPSMIQNVRMSDSFIKPNLYKLMMGAFLFGVFIVIGISILRRRYCA